MSLKKDLKKARELVIHQKLRKINELKGLLRKAGQEDEEFDTGGFYTMLEHHNRKRDEAKKEGEDYRPGWEWLSMYEDMITHPNFPEHAADRIVSQGDERLKIRALEKHTDGYGRSREIFAPHQLAKLAQDEEPDVAVRAIMAPDLPIDTVRSFLDDPHSRFDDTYFRNAALKSISDRNDLTPDDIQKFSDQTKGIGRFSNDILNHKNATPEQKSQYTYPGHIKFPLNSNKIRQLRDFVEEKGGAVHKKEAEKAGFNLRSLGVEDTMEDGRTLTADALGEHIKNLPHHQYKYEESTYGTPSEHHDQEIRDSAEEAAREDYSPYDHIKENVNSISDIPDELQDKFQEWVRESNHWPDTSDLDPDDEDYEEKIDEAEQSVDWDEALGDWLEYEGAEDIWQNGDDFDYWEEISERSGNYIDDARGWHDVSEDDFDEAYEEDPEDALEYASNQQRHSHKPSETFVLDAGRDHHKEMEDAGVLDSYEKIKNNIGYGAHPGGGKTVGWVRYTQADDGVHIDEIQSDLSSALRRLHRAIKTGDSEAHVNDELKEIPAEHVEKINSILFQGQHPSQVLHDAFHQHLRNKGDVGKDVAIWQPESKAPLSDQRVPHKNMDAYTGWSKTGRSYQDFEPNAKVNLTHYSKLHPEDQKMIQDHAKREEPFHDENYHKHQYYTSAKTGRAVQDAKEKTFQTGKPLPVHMQEGYGKQPKKMGYKPSEYGKLETQSNPNLKGQPTWQDKVRKKRSSNLEELEKEGRSHE